MADYNITNKQMHGRPTMYFTGVFSCDRPNTQSKNVTCALRGTITMASGTASDPTEFGTAYGGDGLGFSINDGAKTGDYQNFPKNGGSKSVDLNWSFDLESTTVILYCICQFGSKADPHHCDKGWGKTEMLSVSVPAYNPHQNPQLEIGTKGIDWSDRRYSREWDYRYKTDGHGARIELSYLGNIIVGGSTEWTNWIDKPFIPKDLGIDYDAEYRISGDIIDTSDENFRSHTDGQVFHCYGSLRCSLGNIPKMTKGREATINMTESPDKFTRDSSNVNYGIYIDGVKYTIGSNVSNGQSVHNGSQKFIPDRDNSSYEIKSWVQHAVTGEEWTSDTKTVETYVDPTLTQPTGSSIFSPQDNASISWTSNANIIQNRNESFSQKISISNSTISNRAHSSNSVQLAPDGTYWVQNIFSNSVRSTDQLNSTLSIVLTNEDSGVSASTSKSFTVQYKPTKDISLVSIQNQGKTIAIDEFTTTRLTWSYPYNAGSAGVVSGFYIRIYADSSYSKLVKTIDKSGISYSTFISGNNYTYDLDNETDLMRGVLNYATITPYYQYPTGNTKSEGPTVRIGSVVKPYKYMAKPVISYPINNTTWHNKQFRVLFRLNADNDYNTYKAYNNMFGGTDIQSTYKYSDVELKINGKIYAFSGKYTSQSSLKNLYSSDIDKSNTNNHQKYMAINPSLQSNFENTDFYTMQIRVQRGSYYFTDDEMKSNTIKTWSDWSDEITLNKSVIAPQDLTVGLEIKANHYQTVHSWGLRLLACYPLREKDIRDIDQVRGNQIDGSQPHPDVGEYLGIYNTMLNLIAGVNNYCTYDREEVRFNKTVETFNPLVEIITSAESGTDRYNSTGRNYMNLLTRYMNDYLQ